METPKNRIEWLKQKYFKDDDSFYAHNISIDCFAQAKYQSLRKWEMDYFLVFCDDINAKVYKKENMIKLNTHNFDYNSFLCEYQCVTKNSQEAEKSIKQILEMGNVVVFKTAMDYLHTYAWYHKEEPYTRIQHYSTIIGYDTTDYYYVDVPGTRNPLYFRAHPENGEVGKIDKKELLQSFRYCCEIGYIKVNEEHIKDIAGVNKILKGIVQTYDSINEDKVDCVGKEALEKLIYILRKKSVMEKFVLDEFCFALLASRHRILRIIIQKYESCIEKKRLEKCMNLLEAIAIKWEIIRNIVIKNGISKDDKIGERIAGIIETYIIPWTEELMYNFKCSIKNIE